MKSDKATARPNILVVDDDPNMLALLVHWLEGAGYTVVQGTDAASALALTRALRPALVLLDVMLPDGDGREVARQIKTDPELVDTFVTLLTAQKLSPEDQALALSGSQADGYILQPVSSQGLLGWAQVLLRLQATQVELRQSKALRQSEEKYRIVADFTYDWEYWLAPDGNLLYISPSCERITGYRPEEFLQNPTLIEDIIYPADRALVLQHQQQYHHNGTGDDVLPHNLDFRIITRAGEERWINHVCRHIYDSHGNYLGRRGSNRDVTERKKMEQALRKSEERLEFALTAANDGIWDWDLLTNQAYFSPQYYRMLGYEPFAFEANYQNWRVLLHPDDVARCEAVIQAAIAAGQGYEIEFRMRTQNGNWQWILGRGKVMAVNEYNIPVRMVGTHTDITRRKQVETTLREAEQLLAETQALTRVGGWKCDVATGRMIWTDEVYRIHGVGRDYDPNDTKRSIGFYTPEHAPVIERAFRRAVEQGEPYDLELEFIRADGERIWVRTAAHPLLENGRVVQVQGSLMDITDRKRTENSLRESQFRTRAMLQAIPDLMFRMNREGVFLDYKADLSDLYAQSESTIIGKRNRDIAPPEFADLIDSRIALALETGALQTFEYQLPVPDRGMRSYEARMVASGADEVTAIVRDITDDRQAEEVLRQSEKRFRALVENSADALTLLDGHGNVIYEGPTVERVTGYTIEERIGRNSLETVYSEDVPPVKTVLARVLAQPGCTESLQFRAVRKDGTVQWMEGTATNLLADPHVQAVVVNYHDITARRQAEDDLRDSNELLSLFMAHSPIYAFIKEVTPTESRTLKASENYREMIGISGSQMVGKTMEELFPPDLAAKITADDWSVVSRGEVLRLDEDFNGRNYNTVKFPIRQKERTLLAGYTIDITERKRAEEALRESNELFSLFMEHSPIYVYIKEVTPTQSRTLMASRNFQDMVGIPTSQVIGKKMDEIFPPEAAAKFTADDWTVVSKGEVLELEETLNGRTYTTVKFPIRQKERILLAGYTIDITDLKQAEQALREREENFRAVAENAYDGILTLIETGAPVYANRRAAEITGYSVAELLTMKIQQLIHPDEVSLMIERIRRRISREEAPDQYEIYLVTKDGFDKPVEVSAGYTLWQGQPADLIILRDITERKQTEGTRAKLETQRRQIEKAESLNRMAAAIAHHFNNQLQGVIGYLELAMLGDVASRLERQARNLAYANAAAHKAAEMSGLMLTYLGLTHDEYTALSLSDVCTRELSSLLADLPENVTVKADFPPTGPIINANADRLRQLLINVITNAWEAMGGTGGLISLSITTVSPDSIPAGHRFPPDWQPQSSSYACLSVTDTGSGIAQHDIEKIFDPFFTGKFLGRGLGLPVALGIIRGHAGGVVVQSEVGRGSTFQFLFPTLPWG